MTSTSHHIYFQTATDLYYLTSLLFSPVFLCAKQLMSFLNAFIQINKFKLVYKSEHLKKLIIDSCTKTPFFSNGQLWLSTKHGLDWTGLDSWTGQLDWTVGLDYWTGQLDWTVGLDSWTGLLDWISNGIFSIK